jgi:hypothetical protein
VKIRRVRPAVLQVTLHAAELSSLVAAARWAFEGEPGALPPDARDHLRQVLASYDDEARKLGGVEGHLEDRRSDTSDLHRGPYADRWAPTCSSSSANLSKSVRMPFR